MSKNKKPRTFLCVNGPRAGEYLTWAEAIPEDYDQYNVSSSDLRAAGWPASIFVHKSVRKNQDDVGKTTKLHRMPRLNKVKTPREEDLQVWEVERTI